jgi:2-keto-4-pentenoate hydratase
MAGFGQTVERSTDTTSVLLCGTPKSIRNRRRSPMPVLDDATVDALAERLLDATRQRRAIGRLSDEFPGMDAVDGYRVQQQIVRRRVADGERIVGWKLGLTSRAMQDQLGVDQPDYGPIFDRMMIPLDGAVPVSELIAPRTEAEICFVLRSALRGPGVSREDVLNATDGVLAAIEVIDSRIENWRIGLADTISDLASSARVVTAERAVPLDGFDVRFVGAVLERESDAGTQVVATGAGAAALGDPVTAVAWAANTLGPLGVTLEPGHIVMTGALHASVAAAAGDRFVAHVDRLGSASVRFS